MDYEDYVPESEYYDFEADLFSNMATAEPWDTSNDEDWEYEDWFHIEDYVDEYNEY